LNIGHNIPGSNNDKNGGKPGAEANAAALGTTFPPYIKPDAAAVVVGPPVPNIDPVAGAPQLGCVVLLANDESQFTDAAGAAGGALNALSSSARAEYLSAETGGKDLLTGMGPPTLADIDT